MNEANAIDNSQAMGMDTARTMRRSAEQFMQLKDRVWDRSRYMAKGLNTCVHEHTWMAVGVTAAVGIILGLAVSRR